jgi:hypothetical protein
MAVEAQTDNPANLIIPFSEWSIRKGGDVAKVLIFNLPMQANGLTEFEKCRGRDGGGRGQSEAKNLRQDHVDTYLGSELSISRDVGMLKVADEESFAMSYK